MKKIQILVEDVQDNFKPVPRLAPPPRTTDFTYTDRPNVTELRNLSERIADAIINIIVENQGKVGLVKIKNGEAILTKNAKGDRNLWTIERKKRISDRDSFELIYTSVGSKNKPKRYLNDHARLNIQLLGIRDSAWNHLRYSEFRLSDILENHSTSDGTLCFLKQNENGGLAMDKDLEDRIKALVETQNNLVRELYNTPEETLERDIKIWERNLARATAERRVAARGKNRAQSIAAAQREFENMLALADAQVRGQDREILWIAYYLGTVTVRLPERLEAVFNRNFPDFSGKYDATPYVPKNESELDFTNDAESKGPQRTGPSNLGIRVISDDAKTLQGNSYCYGYSALLTLPKVGGWSNVPARLKDAGIVKEGESGSFFINNATYILGLMRNYGIKPMCYTYNRAEKDKLLNELRREFNIPTVGEMNRTLDEIPRVKVDPNRIAEENPLNLEFPEVGGAEQTEEAYAPKANLVEKLSKKLLEGVIEDLDTALYTPGVWGVEFVGDDCICFETEKEARDYFNSLTEADIYPDGEGIELFKVINEDGDTEIVDSISIYESANKTKKSGKKLSEGVDAFDSLDFSGYTAGTTTYWAYVQKGAQVIKEIEGTYPGPEALRRIIEFIKSLKPEEKDLFGLSWQWDSFEPGDLEGDVVVGVFTKQEMIDEDTKGEKYVSNYDMAARPIVKALGIPDKNFPVDTRSLSENSKAKKSGKRLTEGVDDFDNINFSHPEADSTSYWVYIEDKDTGRIVKSDRRNYCSGPTALRRILAFMDKELTAENKDCFGLTWTWDVEALADDSSDIIVSVATKPAMELEDITEKYTFNVDEAAKYIIDALENRK